MMRKTNAGREWARLQGREMWECRQTVAVSMVIKAGVNLNKH